MKKNYPEDLAHSLQTVPRGAFEMKRYDPSGNPSASQVDPLTTQTTGKGKIESFLVFPGIEISFHQYLAEQVQFHHKAMDSILEIHYCRIGRIGWNMRDGVAIYLGSGDLCVHSMDHCADSEMTLPLGYYEGMSIQVDLQELQKNCPEILQEAGFNAKKTYQKFCVMAKPFGIPSNNETNAIFPSFYGIKKSLRIPFYKLKVQEILLYLQQIEPNAAREFTQYGSQQTELIKEIHDFLVQHLDKRFTIEELGKKYLINTSSLKSIFKAVYGLPIASYMKEFRIKKAMQLLRETDDSIASIAEKVGYETQGKFTKAFKESIRILPKEYRKFYRQ